MKVIYLAKQNPFLIGWMEVGEEQEFDCPECLARLKVVNGELVRIMEAYDEPCPHASLSRKDGALIVYFTRYSEGSELAKQGDYSDYVNLRQLGLTPGQLGWMIGLVNWIRKVFPQVLKKLEEAEELMSNGDLQSIEVAKAKVGSAKITIKVLLEDIDKYAPQSE